MRRLRTMRNGDDAPTDARVLRSQAKSKAEELSSTGATTSATTQKTRAKRVRGTPTGPGRGGGQRGGGRGAARNRAEDAEEVSPSALDAINAFGRPNGQTTARRSKIAIMISSSANFLADRTAWGNCDHTKLDAEEGTSQEPAAEVLRPDADADAGWYEFTDDDGKGDEHRPRPVTKFKRKNPVRKNAVATATSSRSRRRVPQESPTSNPLQNTPSHPSSPQQTPENAPAEIPEIEELQSGDDKLSSNNRGSIDHPNQNIGPSSPTESVMEPPDPDAHNQLGGEELEASFNDVHDEFEKSAASSQCDSLFIQTTPRVAERKERLVRADQALEEARERQEEEEAADRQQKWEAACISTQQMRYLEGPLQKKWRLATERESASRGMPTPGPLSDRGDTPFPKPDNPVSASLPPDPVVARLTSRAPFWDWQSEDVRSLATELRRSKRKICKTDLEDWSEILGHPLGEVAEAVEFLNAAARAEYSERGLEVYIAAR